MYPTDLTIPSSFTNSQYRQFIRKLFNMDLTTVIEENNKIQEHNQEIWDDETTDEMLYDSHQATNFMDFIEKETKNNSLFVSLYEKAAARMFSTDLGIGLAVLLSYDYLYHFHHCLIDYFNNARTLNESNPHFISLNNLLE